MSFTLRCSYLLSFFIAMGYEALAQEEPESITPFELGYATRHWSTYDGLPSNVVLSIAQSDDGYLWVGMSDGLVSFNGRKIPFSDYTSALKTFYKYVSISFPILLSP